MKIVHQIIDQRYIIPERKGKYEVKMFEKIFCYTNNATHDEAKHDALF